MATAPKRAADTTETTDAPDVVEGPEDRAPLRTFTCDTCGNSFEAEGDVSICNGLNVRADAKGKPITDDNDWLEIVDTSTGERAQHQAYGYIVPGYGHAPTVMTRGGAK